MHALRQYRTYTKCVEFRYVEIVTFVGTAVIRNCSYVTNYEGHSMSYGSYFLSEYGSVGNGLYAYLCDIVALCISQKRY
jgi:hypothetical protein